MTRKRPSPDDFSGVFSLVLVATVVGLVLFIPLLIFWIEHVLPLPGGD